MFKIETDPGVDKLIWSLEKPTIYKILRTIDLLERFGYQLSMPHSKKITDNLFELRVRGQQEVRIFYCFHQGRAHLLSGFVKKSQKTPRTEIDKAINKRGGLT